MFDNFDEKSEGSFVHRLIYPHFGADKPLKLPLEPNDRVGVRRLRTMKAYLVRAEQLHR